MHESVTSALLLLAALVCGHAAARTLAVTLLAPVAAATASDAQARLRRIGFTSWSMATNLFVLRP